ncbi:MAG: hypothetical protein ACRYHQ_41065 [Janthinobacterium lividum]
MSNAVKMSLEERIVQTLKDDSLMKLVGDEDAITDLVTRAIHEALFQPRRAPNGYGGAQDTDAPVVVAARKAAQEYAEKVAQQCIEELVADPANRMLIHNAIVDLLPAALSGYLQHALHQMHQQTEMTVRNTIFTMRQNREI